MSKYQGPLEMLCMSEDQIAYLFCEAGGKVDAPSLTKAYRHIPDAATYFYGKHRYYMNGLYLDDLVSAGLLGLVKAVRRYDPEKGSFYTYARHIIQFSFIDECRRLPGYSRVNGSSIKEIVMIEDMYNLSTDGPSVEDLVVCKHSIEHIVEACEQCLTAIEYEVFTDHFIVGLSQSQVASNRGVTPSRISQIIKDCINKLRFHMGVNNAE